jgi:hypothetical protein
MDAIGRCRTFDMAEGPGFEPGLTESESAMSVVRVLGQRAVCQGRTNICPWHLVSAAPVSGRATLRASAGEHWRRTKQWHGFGASAPARLSNGTRYSLGAIWRQSIFDFPGGRLSASRMARLPASLTSQPMISSSVFFSLRSAKFFGSDSICSSIFQSLFK